jgi:hypothetical protein
MTKMINISKIAAAAYATDRAASDAIGANEVAALTAMGAFTPATTTPVRRARDQGSAKQLTARYNELVAAALNRGITTLLVGHTTRRLRLRTATFTAPHSGYEAVAALEAILA